MSDTLLYITAVIYLGATLVYSSYLFLRKESLIKVGQIVFMAGFALHTISIILRWIEAGRTPAASLHESLSFFSWITVALYVYILFKYKQKVLGAFVAPFALVLLIMASFRSEERRVGKECRSRWSPY